MIAKVIIAVFVLVVVGFGATFFFRQPSEGPQSSVQTGTVTMVSPGELEVMLTNKDFQLIDVHIPEQLHIPGTDYMIPFNEIDRIVEALPDKDQKVVFYCRSGGMSGQVVKEMVNRGYTNIFDLENGMNQWLSEGRETLPLGSVEGL